MAKAEFSASLLQSSVSHFFFVQDSLQYFCNIINVLLSLLVNLMHTCCRKIV